MKEFIKKLTIEEEDYLSKIKPEYLGLEEYELYEYLTEYLQEQDLEGSNPKQAMLESIIDKLVEE